MGGRHVLEALDDALRTGDDIDAVIGFFFRMAQEADEASRVEMMQSLEPRIRAHPIERTGPLGILAGAFVELGVDPVVFPSAVFDRLLEQLETIESPDDETELPEAYYLLERAAMACLGRCPELRRTLPQKPALLAALRRYRERYGFLGKMLQVLDDEPLVVLHPATQRGFRFTMHGIADNFQLHLLLLGALAGAGRNRIEGKVPTPEMIAVSTDAQEISEAIAESDWQLANWFALRPGGELDTEDKHNSWIWNEGVPADIASFDGTRVVLIGPSSYHRTWPAQRALPSMVGRLDGPKRLVKAEVRALLRDMEARARG